MDLQALIFDVDGTLADTEQDGHRVAFNLAFAEAGFDWEWSRDLYLELLEVAGGKGRIRSYCERYQPGFLTRGDMRDVITRLHDAKTAAFADLVSRGEVGLLPGVADLLGEARAAGVRLAIATTTSPVIVSSLLRGTLGDDAQSWFEVVATREVEAPKKPAPAIYLWVLERLGLPGQACLAFEDSGPGFGAATQAGIPTVVVPSSQASGEQFEGAVAVFSSLAETDLADLTTRHAAAQRR